MCAKDVSDRNGHQISKRSERDSKLYHKFFSTITLLLFGFILDFFVASKAKNYSRKLEANSPDWEAV